MCGRYTLFADEMEIMERFGLDYIRDSYEKSYNIAPGQKVLVIIHDGEKKRAGYLRWGLVPFFAKDEKIGYKMINARSETAHEKPSFKHLMAKKRCLIVADSFYEWKKEGDIKQPYRIQMRNRKLFAFAGLWDKWQKGDRTLFTCTILTKDANDFMKNIHHRMPIILPKNMEDEWIKPNQMSAYDAYEFLKSIEMDSMSANMVSTYVNSAANNSPKCVEPLVN